jgi:hypothetical protein
LSISSLLKWFPSTSPMSKLGSTGSLFTGVCLLSWAQIFHLKLYFSRVPAGVPVEQPEVFLFSAWRFTVGQSPLYCHVAYCYMWRFSTSEFHLLFVYCLLFTSLAFPHHQPLPVDTHY